MKKNKCINTLKIGYKLIFNILTKHVILLLSSISLVYFLVYFIRFNGPLSTDINDFVGFGTYLGGIGSITSAITLIYLIIENNKLREEKKKDEEKQKILSLVEHFELNQIEVERILHFIKMNENIDTDQKYLIRGILYRIDYIYLKCADSIDLETTDLYKNILLNKIPKSLLDDFKSLFPNVICTQWLILRNDLFRLYLGQRKAQEEKDAIDQTIELQNR